jgi:hypothetical protein
MYSQIGVLQSEHISTLIGWCYKTYNCNSWPEFRNISMRAMTGWFYKTHKFSSLYHPVWRKRMCTAMLILQNTRVFINRRNATWACVRWQVDSTKHTHSYRPMCRDVSVSYDRLIELLHMSRDMNYACRNRSILHYTVWSFTRIGMPSDKNIEIQSDVENIIQTLISQTKHSDFATWTVHFVNIYVKTNKCVKYYSIY